MVNGVSRVAQWIAIACAAATLLVLALLHVVSPEYDPSWRMVSEYANGKNGWLLAVMFLTWGVSDWALLVGLWREEKRALFRVGLLFLFVAGLGTGSASLLDINNPLHDIAGALGIIGTPVAAVLITAALRRSSAWSVRKRILLWSSNLTWVSVVLFAASFGVMVLTFQRAGIKMDPQAGPTAHAPAGVMGYVGWADRLIVVVYCLWVSILAWQAIKLSEKPRAT
ncbi:MAG TPA: DUF998 domain-containing protein [Spirochaetia bacterium]|nr:DUF998 domain-containing protein [Spirochaetia bacterium]